MPLNFRKFLNGLKILPKKDSSTSSSDAKGELDVIDIGANAGKLIYHNGSSVSPVVTENHIATLTQKTLTSPKIDTIDGVAGADLTVQSVSNQDLILQSQGSGDVFLKTPGAGDVNLQTTGTGNIRLDPAANSNVYINSSSDTVLTNRVKIDQLICWLNSIYSGSGLGTDGSSVIINDINIQSRLGPLPPTIFTDSAAYGLKIAAQQNDLMLEQGNNKIVQLGQQSNFATTLVRSNSDFKPNKKLLLQNVPLGLAAGAQTNLVLSPVTAYTVLSGTGITSLSIAGINSFHGANLAGQFFVITNNTDSNLVILNESAATTVENRIQTATGSNVTVSQGGSVILIYDEDEGLIGNPARWRLINGIQSAASGATNVVTIVSSTALTNSNDIVLVNGTGVTVTLPAPGSLGSGKVFNIKKIFNDIVPVVIQCATATIDGVASISIIDRYDSLTITTDGSNYFII